MEKLGEQLWPFLLIQGDSNYIKCNKLQVLPTTASGNDLLVTVCCKLHDNEHDPSNNEVAVRITKEGEELSLWDKDSVFLRVPVLKEELSRASSTPSKEVSIPALESGSLRT